MSSQRRAWRVGALLAVGLLVGSVGVARAAGCGQDDCGNSGLHSATYGAFGIDIFRHEAQIWGCENDTVVTQQGLVRNAIVGIGIGHIYGHETSEAWGPVNVRQTWADINGCATFEVCAPPFGTPCVTFHKCNRWNLDWFVASDHVLYYYYSSQEL